MRESWRLTYQCRPYGRAARMAMSRAMEMRTKVVSLRAWRIWAMQMQKRCFAGAQALSDLQSSLFMLCRRLVARGAQMDLHLVPVHPIAIFARSDKPAMKTF